jgi:hypothetical protein
VAICHREAEDSGIDHHRGGHGDSPTWGDDGKPGHVVQQSDLSSFGKLEDGPMIL